MSAAGRSFFMKTKAQKVEQVKEAAELLKKSKLLVFADFTGLKVENLKKLRKILKAGNNVLSVVKKRLLRVVLKNEGIDFTPEQFETQAATIFSNQNLEEIAGPVYKFSKDSKDAFKILGAYDLAAKKFIEATDVIFIGQLPSREVLLAQLAGLFTAPLKMFMFILSEKSKRS